MSSLATDRNYWATYRDSIADWYGELPPPGKLGVERVFEFARHILDTAEREQVMRVLGVPALPGARHDLTWFELAQARFEREGRLNLFPSHGHIPERLGGGWLRLPARLAYYQGERIVEESVEDVGDLEKAVVTARGGDPGGIRSTLAIVLNGGALNEPDQPLSPGRPPTGALEISLGLYTDLWFPRVIGLRMGDLSGRADEWHPARGRDRLMDNSALAARHTPRLNRFIETLRDAILELGGRWNEPGADPSYKPMVHSGGILLDYPSANA